MRRAAGFLLWSVLNLLLGSVLLVAAALRETPLFWRNAGGFPVLLRELVLLLFYPGLMLLAIGVLWSTWTAWRWRPGSRLAVAVWMACLFQWLLLLVVIAIFAWNNLNNLLEGTPLHQHAP